MTQEKLLSPQLGIALRVPGSAEARDGGQIAQVARRGSVEAQNQDCDGLFKPVRDSRVVNCALQIRPVEQQAPEIPELCRRISNF